MTDSNPSRRQRALRAGTTNHAVEDSTELRGAVRNGTVRHPRSHRGERVLHPLRYEKPRDGEDGQGDTKRRKYRGRIASRVGCEETVHRPLPLIDTRQGHVEYRETGVHRKAVGGYARGRTGDSLLRPERHRTGEYGREVGRNENRRRGCRVGEPVDHVPDTGHGPNHVAVRDERRTGDGVRDADRGHLPSGRSHGVPVPTVPRALVAHHDR